MTAATDKRLRGATRWSLTARCVRMAFYGFTGVEPAEPDEETKLRWERGQMDEDWMIRQLRARHGRKNVRVQKAVPWPSEGLPLGELHQDAYIVSERLPVEIKSHLNGDISDSDIIQLAGEILYDPEADDRGVLIAIDRDLRRREIPVILNDQLRAEVETRASALTEAVLTETVPARVCEKPSDGRSLLCPFVSYCFADWEPEQDVISLDGPEFAELAETALQAKRRRDETKAAYDAAETEWKEATAALAEHDWPAGKSVCAGIQISRSPRNGRTTFRYSEAVKTGAWTPLDDERLGAFVHIGDGYDVWDAERVAKPSAEDFGDEAPWTDDDLKGHD